MKAGFTILCAMAIFSAFGQYTTPGTGLVLDMDELVSISGGVVSGASGTYTVSENLTISGIDTLRILDPDQVSIAPDILITIEGALLVDAEALFTVECCEGFYEGFRLEETAHTRLSGATFEFGGGIRVLGGDFEMHSCTVQYNTTGVSTGGAIGLSSGKPVVANSLFLENESAAISSSANIAVAPLIEGNTFTGNNTGNSNRPQINLGPSGADTTKIAGNIVTGYNAHEQAGGIGFSSLTGVEAHALISGNTVSNNRYGIAVIGGNIFSRVENNVVQENNIQNDPNLGGSGINFNNAGDNGHIVLGNTITGNLWGITLQGNAQINLGESENTDVGPGNNFFQDNGNGGTVYALYNNTPNTLWAQENCWDGNSSFITEEDIEAVIFHSIDDAGLGEVFFTPFSQCIFIPSAENVDFTALAQLFPNPAKDRFTIVTERPLHRMELSTVHGRVIASRNLAMVERVDMDVAGLAPGLYLIRIWGADFTSVGRLVVE